MKKYIPACLMMATMFAFYACGKSKQNAPENKPSNKTVYSGEELYGQKCSACHGSDGNMGVAGAKKIPLSILTQEERVTLISNGKTTMPAFKDQLSEEEIKKVAEYTFTLK